MARPGVGAEYSRVGGPAPRPGRALLYYARRCWSSPVQIWTPEMHEQTLLSRRLAGRQALTGAPLYYTRHGTPTSFNGCCTPPRKLALLGCNFCCENSSATRRVIYTSYAIFEPFGRFLQLLLQNLPVLARFDSILAVFMQHFLWDGPHFTHLLWVLWRECGITWQNVG